ncbi:hypothetical protein EDB81DRAFT_664083 [Dactylonectria macrodidyma]|uniref:Uncharacterized protein n=1 Tax=Dactylonectria macrodidyma TaxID=307937 RepID=A0A9P9DSL4_9HYPO|nr:hypothetical protein EDB81DRAFT_664083 [Dactylonectria macrodidyma]
MISPIYDLDNLFKIAEAEGKTSELCDPGSTFRTAAEICRKCLEDNEAMSTDVSYLDLIVPGLDEYLDFCHIGVTTLTHTFTGTNGQVSTVRYVVPGLETITASMPTTALESPSLSTRSGSSNSYVMPVDSPSMSLDNSPGDPGNKSWIAGPLLGSIIGVAVILGTVIHIWRRRSSITRSDGLEPPNDKAQLHSDCIPKPAHETEAQVMYEMEGSSAQPVETVANEVPAVELVAAGKRNNAD